MSTSLLILFSLLPMLFLGAILLGICAGLAWGVSVVGFAVRSAVQHLDGRPRRFPGIALAAPVAVAPALCLLALPAVIAIPWGTELALGQTRDMVVDIVPGVTMMGVMSIGLIALLSAIGLAWLALTDAVVRLHRMRRPKLAPLTLGAAGCFAMLITVLNPQSWPIALVALACGFADPHGWRTQTIALGAGAAFSTGMLALVLPVFSTIGQSSGLRMSPGFSIAGALIGFIVLALPIAAPVGLSVLGWVEDRFWAMRRATATPTPAEPAAGA